MDGDPQLSLVGVLAVQGDFREHQQVLTRTGRCRVRLVRSPSDLDGLAGLVIPGGESTAITKLVVKLGLFEPLRLFLAGERPIFATCAGMILVGSGVADGEQPQLKGMDIVVRRNAFGRQNQSFETWLDIEQLAEPFPAVFIRAPWVEKAGPQVEVLAQIAGHPVLVRQGSLLAAAFHPELTNDQRLHYLFLDQLNGAT